MQETTSTMNKLHPLSVGLSIGLLWGIGMLFVGLTAAYLDWGVLFVRMMGSVYVGFTPSFVGSVIGAVFGFVD